MKRCTTCRHAKQVGCMDLIVLFRCGRSGRTVAEGDTCADWEPCEPRPARGCVGRATENAAPGMER